MGLKDFLEKSQKSAPKPFERNESDGSDRLNLLYMNAPVNQGILKFIPILALNGDEVSYLYDVSEFQVYTLNDDDEKQWRWGKVLQQKDYISELTPENKDQIGRIHSLIASAIELAYGTDWARNGKNYAIFFGYVLSHINADQEVLTNLESRKMSLIICPSKNVAKAMTTMSEGMITSAAGEEQFDMIFNREAKDRKCYLEMSFKQGSGFGYDVTIQAKVFDLFSRELLTEAENKKSACDVPEDLIKKCTNHSSIFVGNYDEENTGDFVPEYLNRMEEQIQGEINKTVAANKAAEGLPPVPENPDGVDPNKPTGAGWTGGQQ